MPAACVGRSTHNPIDFVHSLRKNGLIRTNLWCAMERTVTTAKAAEIISIGYEGLRSYLKRGLLGDSGLMASFVSPDTPAPDRSRIRAKWTRFGFVDLCLMRLAKQLIDLGLSFDQANGIASASELREIFAHEQRVTGAAVMAWPPNYDFIVFAGDDLRYLSGRLAEVGDVAVLVQLDRISEHVRLEINRVIESEGASGEKKI